MILPALVLSIALVATPLSGRVELVKKDLRAGGVPNEYVAALFKDKRIKVYPASVVPRYRARTKYSANILAVESIERGVKFLENYADELAAAEAAYGIPKEEIVAVIRVESNLGEYLGTLTVFNVLYTRMVTAPDERWKWDATNLAALGKYCYLNSADCFSVKGSSAGAFGLAQFLPYSVFAWGVDGNGDGFINLFDAADSIPSAANFLKSHGWRENSALALARYYGSGKTYPATVLGYADALRETASNAEPPPPLRQGKVARLLTPVVSSVYCLFSISPYCAERRGGEETEP